MNLKAELEHLMPSVEPSPWRGHEHVRGYGIFGLPLSSGHTFALRVFPINDFAPYVTVWHQAPDGIWSIHYQAPRPDIACPRYYGAAARHIAPATIDLEWHGGAELTIRVDRPQLEWTVWMHEPPILRPLNMVSKRLPFWTWQHASLLQLREWMAPAGHGRHHAGRAHAERPFRRLDAPAYVPDRSCARPAGGGRFGCTGTSPSEPEDRRRSAASTRDLCHRTSSLGDSRRSGVSSNAGRAKGT